MLDDTTRISRENLVIPEYTLPVGVFPFSDTAFAKYFDEKKL